MQIEEWRGIPGHEDTHEVSSFGRARSLTRVRHYSDGRVGTTKGKILKDSRGVEGYRKIDLGRDSKRMYLHRAVALAFLGPEPSWAECVNHKDGDKRNNSVDNLEWSTLAENNRHARDSGLLKQHGQNCNLTKYSDQLVFAIRKVHEKYKPTYRELADMFDVSETLAAQVVKMETRVR